MTPRQLAAGLELEGRRRRRIAAEDLGIAALGARGDGKEIAKRIAEWSD
jgi:hypothetical protein